MKKLYTLLVVALIGYVGKAQIINFPDSVFKGVLLSASPSNQVAKNLAGNYFKIDANNDSQIDVSEALQVKQLSFINTSTTSLVGIEYFTNLTFLACNQNHIISLDVTALVNLTTLDCSANLTITSLNVTGLTNLQTLYCNDNVLTNLDLTGVNTLNYLNCQANHLTSLNLSGKTNLQSLYAGSNQFTSLDISDCIIMSIFAFDYNPLVSIFMKNGKTESIQSFNHITTLQYVCADESEIANVQAYLTSYSLTNCYVNSYCSFTPGGAFYTISGSNTFDSNSNGCDSLDGVFPNMKFTISNGTTTGSILSNATGNYTIPVQAGTYTITPNIETSTYFSISSTNASVVFPTQGSPFVQNFCIAPSGTHNDLEVAMIPLTTARPGFDNTYKIICKNKGTTIQSGSINLVFNDAVMDFVSADQTVTSQTTNNLNWNFSNLNPLQTDAITLNFNLNSPLETPAVNAGDILNFTLTATGATDEFPTDNSTVFHQTVVNSLDPNDKTCTEGTTIPGNLVGKFVHYVIRFENDGTANAQNIVVKDIIDTTKFDISTLVPLTASANFTTRITNTNQVEFIFQNINLPFVAGTNGGYIAFKIKTKSTLLIGNTFTNKASIYFDYNAPIVTNTATTTIAALANPEFVFTDYFTLSPIPTKGELNITTKQDITITSISIYNTLGQVMLVTSNPSNTIDVSNLNTGSYFIKVITDKGTSSGKFMKE